MQALRLYLKLVRWDWVREMKRKDTILSMIMFSLVTLFIFSFAIPTESLTAENWQAGILWVTLLMASAIGVDRAFRGAGEERMLEGQLLAPVGRLTLYWAKVTSTFLYLMVMEVVILLAFCLLYNVDLGLTQVGAVLATVVATTVGIVAVGVTLSAMTRSLHGGDVLLRILMFSLLIPLFWSAVKVTHAIFQEQPVELTAVGIIIAFDLFYLAAGHLLFEPIMQDFSG